VWAESLGTVHLADRFSCLQLSSDRLPACLPVHEEEDQGHVVLLLLLLLLLLLAEHLSTEPASKMAALEARLRGGSGAAHGHWPSMRASA